MFKPIRLRPVEATDRQQIGHLEGDLIIGARNASAIITVFDRASRYLWLSDLPEGHGADATLAGLTEILERIPSGRLGRPSTAVWAGGLPQPTAIPLARMVLRTAAASASMPRRLG